MPPSPDEKPSPAGRVSRTVRIGGIAILLVGLAALAFVFWPRPQYQPSTRQEKALLSIMISDLTGLRIAEGAVFGFAGRYTGHADSTDFLQSIGMNPPSITLKGEGWYATVTHTQLPGVTCAIAIGTRNPLQRSAPEGEVVCR